MSNAVKLLMVFGILALISAYVVAIAMFVDKQVHIQGMQDLLSEYEKKKTELIGRKQELDDVYAQLQEQLGAFAKESKDQARRAALEVQQTKVLETEQVKLQAQQAKALQLAQERAEQERQAQLQIQKLQTARDDERARRRARVTRAS